MITNLTSTSISLQWEIPEEHNGIIRSYEIELTENDTGLTINFRTTERNYIVENLRPSYWYAIKVQAVTVKPGELSEGIVFKMLEDREF